MKRIKHNDLTHYFLRPHEQLPRAYLRKCEKFFRTIQDRLIKKKDAAVLFKLQAASTKQQAASNKRQASSLTDLDSGTIKDLESRKL
jgi:hypothetical protein